MFKSSMKYFTTDDCTIDPFISTYLFNQILKSLDTIEFCPFYNILVFSVLDFQ